MPNPNSRPSPPQQAVIDRFVAACQGDARVVAAFLGGSLARGTADAYSDLDLYLITTDTGYDSFFAARTAFFRRLGDPLMLEDWVIGGVAFLNFILADGTDGELGLGRAGDFAGLHVGPYQVLLDKAGILAGIGFLARPADPAAQRELLRGLIHWFWHDLAHFTTALGRGQVWAAAGALEDLRRTCVNLARLERDFAAPADGYEKLERALPVEQLAPLRATFCALEPAALLAAGQHVFAFYQALAPRLATAYGLSYPAGLAPIFQARLAALDRGNREPGTGSRG
jgi:predicted nucleotidyltransferase